MCKMVIIDPDFNNQRPDFVHGNITYCRPIMHGIFEHRRQPTLFEHKFYNIFIVALVCIIINDSLIRILMNNHRMS